MARVLVVDDDETFRPMLEAVLERFGHDVRSARNGTEALRHYTDDAPMVVLTDIIMPGMDGLETIRALKKQDNDVRIIAMSGGGRIGPTGYLKMAASLGARCTLMKPFSIQELKDAVSMALEEEMDGARAVQLAPAPTATSTFSPEAAQPPRAD
jgi:DNA-binding NtrC family response regulator